MIRRPPRSTQSRSSAASDVYKRQVHKVETVCQEDDWAVFLPKASLHSLDDVCSEDMALAKLLSAQYVAHRLVLGVGVVHLIYQRGQRCTPHERKIVITIECESRRACPGDTRMGNVFPVLWVCEPTQISITYLLSLRSGSGNKIRLVGV
eukprot:TRINITY_DN2037_c0_g1_i4.p2 TRINITY_DN2037_c0_g1~~TRINITY_DN2037_c0_g1_i4.p2  ORF type:complete len:150 (+),score=21.79 TRINITY_DN2037_c0_g1_i4:103-552(+)